MVAPGDRCSAPATAAAAARTVPATVAAVGDAGPSDESSTVAPLALGGSSSGAIRCVEPIIAGARRPRDLPAQPVDDAAGALVGDVDAELGVARVVAIAAGGGDHAE